MIIRNAYTLVFIMLFLSYKCFSQVSFVKGYFIDNSDEKVECLIKDVNWKNNPKKFFYKFSEKGPIETATIQDVKEFGLYGISRYVRFYGKVDKSVENVKDLSRDKNPEFEYEQLFLKVLVEGKANLFLFESPNLFKYFFSIDSAEIEQLIFKSYKVSDTRIAKNNSFRQQLLSNLQCPDFNIDDFKDLPYRKKELINLFVKYNQCIQHGFKSYQSKKIFSYNLNIRPGLSSSSLTIQNEVSGATNTDFEKRLSFRAGLEVEFFLPFRKNKWAVVLEPTYRDYKSTVLISSHAVTERVFNSNVHYNSIEVPVGIRHYFYLSSVSKLFINASYIADIQLNSFIEFTRLDGSSIYSSLKPKSNGNLGFGMGYKYKRYSLEGRYQTSRNILNQYVAWHSQYKTISVVLGYAILSR